MCAFEINWKLGSSFQWLTLFPGLRTCPKAAKLVTLLQQETYVAQVSQLNAGGKPIDLLCFSLVTSF